MPRTTETTVRVRPSNAATASRTTSAAGPLTVCCSAPSSRVSTRPGPVAGVVEGGGPVGPVADGTDRRAPRGRRAR